MLTAEQIYMSLQAIDPRFTTLDQIEDIVNFKAYEAARYSPQFYHSTVKHLIVSEHPYAALRQLCHIKLKRMAPLWFTPEYPNEVTMFSSVVGTLQVIRLMRPDKIIIEVG
ncbi:MAG: hypothetical protein K6T83_03685 [Alicyclobacillus sp.]|nr:hypothetical protein [Alicyclobacillus sp.]